MQGAAGLPGRRGKPGKTRRGKNGKKGPRGFPGTRGYTGMRGIQGHRGQCSPSDCGALPQYQQNPYTYTDNKGPPAPTIPGGNAANRPPDGVMFGLPSLPRPRESLPNLPGVGPAILQQLKGPTNTHVVNLDDFPQQRPNDVN
ncbi:uncharacterized protein LOC144745067 [Ciona intestinalis]